MDRADGMHGYRADIVFDGERVLPGGALVLVRDGVIAGVEPGEAPAPDGVEVSHAPGTCLLPGLIDTHTHVCGNDQLDALDRLPGLSADELDEAIEAALAAHLAAGVTAVRDLGDQQWAVVDRHRNRPDGPTVVASGPPITSVGGHCAGTRQPGVGDHRAGRRRCPAGHRARVRDEPGCSGVRAGRSHRPAPAGAGRRPAAGRRRPDDRRLGAA